MTKKNAGRQLTREEYRRALLIERRRTMRTVRNTLIGIAVIAALWFFLLLAKDRALRQAEPVRPPAAAKTVSVPDTPNPSEAAPPEKSDTRTE